MLCEAAQRSGPGKGQHPDEHRGGEQEREQHRPPRRRQARLPFSFDHHGDPGPALLDGLLHEAADVGAVVGGTQVVEERDRRPGGHEEHGGTGDDPGSQ